MSATTIEAAGVTQRARWSSLLSPARIAAIAVLGSIPVRLLSDRLADPDLWWHLRTGALIARSRAIPDGDPYSFTRPGEPWVVQEWGSEVILHALREWFGLYGILFFRALVLFAVYVLLARIIVRRMGSGIGTWALVALGAYGGSINWTERPNILSFLLFVVTLDLLDRKGRSIWWFVPLAALWANLHGMVILGIGLVGLVAVVEAGKAWMRWEGHDRVWARTLALVTVASLGATMLNPAGPRLLTHALGLLSAVRGIVTEWESPDFHNPGAMVFLLLVLVVVVAAAFGPSRPDPTDVALALAFLVLALQAARNLAVAAIVLSLVAARWIPLAMRHVTRPPEARQVGSGGSKALGVFGLASIVIAFTVILIDGFPRSGRVEDIVEDTYPVAAIDALRAPGTRVLVDDPWSGMVIDRAWPDAKVYVDLRTDFYGRELMHRYIRAVSAQPDWRETLDEACVTHVLIEPSDPLSQVLRLDPGWTLARSDDISNTFVRRDAGACRDASAG